MDNTAIHDAVQSVAVRNAGSNGTGGWKKVQKKAPHDGMGSGFASSAELLARVYGGTGDISLTEAAWYAIGAPDKVCFLSDGRMAALAAADKDDRNGYIIRPRDGHKEPRSRAQCALDEIGLLVPGFTVTYTMHVVDGMLVTDPKNDKAGIEATVTRKRKGK